MLTRQITFPVDAERLWEALVNPSPWIGAQVEWDLVPGGVARFHGDPDGDRGGRVSDVEPGRRLSFRWWPEADRDDESEVTYELEPAEDGTRLTVTERRVGPSGVPQDSATRTSPATWTSWDSRLALLRVEGHGGQTVPAGARALAERALADWALADSAMVRLRA